MSTPEVSILVPLPNSPGVVVDTIYMLVGMVCIRAKPLRTFVVPNSKAKCGEAWQRSCGIPKRKFDQPPVELATPVRKLSMVSSIFTGFTLFLAGSLTVGSRQVIVSVCSKRGRKTPVMLIKEIRRAPRQMPRKGGSISHR